MIAIIFALVVTFTADHSAPLGFVTFGVFAVATGVLLGAGLMLPSTPPGGEEHRRGRALIIVQGSISVVAGAIALAVPGGGLAFLVFIVTGFALFTGALELVSGVRSRQRDSVFVGGLTVLLGVVVLLIPPGFQQAYSTPDGVERVLTAAVIVVGTLGAYWAVAGVYLAIAGLSAKWAVERGREAVGRPS